MAEEVNEGSGGSVWVVIDTTGAYPTLKPKALAALLTGSVLWGWYAGFLNFLNAVFGGITSSIDGFASFNTGVLWSGIFGIAEAGLDAAAESNAEFVANFGLFSQLVAFVEGVLVVAGVLWVLSTVISWIRGAI